eukprot:TRINITY_DN56216_c0_g1_i1.p1 TRINITY_DN56216_c0_g1~~TRINITY_DN56216_c0_g1_i1.p1  ORF type:complete len:381 (+),score=23.20 TRINITY_DN56216_c0_g1_i1:29-1144(+)
MIPRGTQESRVDGASGQTLIAQSPGSFVGSNTRLVISLFAGERLLVVVLALLFILCPVLALIRCTVAVSISLALVQVSFAFISLPLVGRIRTKTRIALVLALPFAPVAAGLCITDRPMQIQFCNSAVVPIFAFVIIRLLSVGSLTCGKLRALFWLFVLSQTQLGLLLPQNLSWMRLATAAQNHGFWAAFLAKLSSYTTVILLGIVFLSGSICFSRCGVLWVTLLLSQGLLAIRQADDTPNDTVPDWMLALSVQLMGLSIILSVLKLFRSRAHQAARHVFENLGAPSSPQREELVAQVEAITWQEGGEDQGCAICFLPFEPGQQLSRLPCGHSFCSDCIRTWLLGAELPTCPNCRAVVAPQRNREQEPQQSV